MNRRTRSSDSARSARGRALPAAGLAAIGLLLAHVGSVPPGRAGAAPASTAQDPLAAEAAALLESGEYAAAEPLLRRLVAREGSLPLHQYFLGFCLLSRSQYKEAETYLRAATEARPREHHWLQALAKVLLAQDRHVEAIRVLDRAIAVKDVPEYRFARAVCALNAGRRQEAEPDFRAFLRSRPEHAQASYELGRIVADRGDDAASLLLFRRCLAAEPGHVECRFRLGLAETKAGDAQAAIADFESVVKQVPGHVGALLNLGQTLSRLGRREEARKWLERFRTASVLQDEVEFQQATVALDVTDAAKRHRLAELLLQVGRLDEAVKEAHVLIGLDPSRAASFRLLAVALGRLGRSEEAASATARASQIERSAR